MNELNWGWIALMIAAPLPLAILVAAPVWKNREMILGNIAGTIVIFGTALALIFRESVALDALRQACFDAGAVACFPSPSAFTRYAIYASIGLAEVLALFVVSLSV